ncbi:arg, partial [Symbiodinium sp. CCMP2456]
CRTCRPQVPIVRSRDPSAFVDRSAYRERDTECLADGTPIARAGNAAIYPSAAAASMANKPSRISVDGCLADGTAFNRAGNAINHPESTVLPVFASRSSAGVPDAGCLADGTPIELAGNRSLKFFHPSKTSLVADVHELARTAGDAEEEEEEDNMRDGKTGLVDRPPAEKMLDAGDSNLLELRDPTSSKAVNGSVRDAATRREKTSAAKDVPRAAERGQSSVARAASLGTVAPNITIPDEIFEPSRRVGTTKEFPSGVTSGAASVSRLSRPAGGSTVFDAKNREPMQQKHTWTVRMVIQIRIVPEDTAEPQISHWRQLLEQARLEKSLVPDIEAVDDGFPAAWGGSALRIFRQRSILQEEWLHSFMPQSRKRLPTLLAFGSSKGAVCAKLADQPGLCMTKSSLGSVGPRSNASVQTSFWSRLWSLRRCYSSLLRRCSRISQQSEAESLPGASAPWVEEVWPLSCQDIKEAWVRAFMDMSLMVAGAGPAAVQEPSQERVRRSLRAFTVPVLRLLQVPRAATLKCGQGRLIELLYVITSPSSAELEDGSPAVAQRLPNARCEDARSRQMQAMLDSRIASFCCTSQVPERTPFAFTVLAAVLPPEEEVESPSHLSADPTDFLYCTAVRFIEGGRCLAYCLVSRHPFVEAFGQLLVMLHDGEEVLEDVGEAEMSIHDVPAGEGDVKDGEDPGLEPEPDRLRRVAHKLFNAVPQLRPETRRSRTEPSKAVEAALSDLNEDVGRIEAFTVNLGTLQAASCNLDEIDAFIPLFPGCVPCIAGLVLARTCKGGVASVSFQGRMSEGASLGLAVPQWQGAGVLGAGTVDALRGAELAREVLLESLPSRVPMHQLPVPEPEDGEEEDSVKFRRSLRKVLASASELLRAEQPSQVWTVGGDCSVDLTPISYLAERYGERLCVAYVDAHCDLNKEAESPSGHFHGMSLRAALGEGPQGLRAPFQALGPERLVMLGIRDADPAEEQFIQEAKVKRLTTRDLQSNLEDAIRVVTDVAGPTGLLHVHLDLDVMDPSAFPHVNVPTAGGLLPAELKALLGRLSSAFAGRICGTTVTELRLREEGNQPAASAKQLLSSLLGQGGLDLAGQVSAWQPPE